jgi:hypothetical protein
VPLVPQRTLIGQRPGVVFDPTRHRQVIRAPVLAPSPFTREMTVAYRTSIVQRLGGDTLTVRDA